jgi:hypothetical protein
MPDIPIRQTQTHVPVLNSFQNRMPMPLPPEGIRRPGRERVPPGISRHGRARDRHGRRLAAATGGGGMAMSSIIDDMRRDRECIGGYHQLAIVDAWCRAGGTLEEMHDLLAFWPKCAAVARLQAGDEMLWYHFAEAAEELLAEAKAALQSRRLEELARAWWPAGVPTRVSV